MLTRLPEFLKLCQSVILTALVTDLLAALYGGRGRQGVGGDGHPPDGRRTRERQPRRHRGHVRRNIDDEPGTNRR